jgi:hypothetical protein
MGAERMNPTIVKPITTPVEAVVDMLKDMLIKAESGELRAIAIAGVLTSSETLNGWAGRYYPVALIGELEVVKRELMDANVDLRGVSNDN